jgi:hypothetical protein
MYHPGCWVRNDGCSTQTEHRQTPAAIAFGVSRPAADPAPAVTPEAPRPTSPVGVPAAQPTFAGSQAVPHIRSTPEYRSVERPPDPVEGVGAPPSGASTEFVIGALQPQEQVRSQRPVRAPAPYVATIESARRRPPPDPSGAPHRPLPRLYGRHKFLGYWYIPAAVVVAVVVAGAVIFVADRLFGSGDGDKSSAGVVVTTTPTDATATASATAAGSVTATGTATTTTTATVTASVTPGSGTLQVGDAVVVNGTGDCLNVRSAAGTDASVVACVPDGTQLTIRGGPQSAGGLRWWQVAGSTTEGWAAEDYLGKP